MSPSTTQFTLTEQQATDLGSRFRLDNLLATGITGAALLFTGLFSWNHWILGLVIGFVYANLFEYAYHRFGLHEWEGRSQKNHQVHHRSWGEPDEGLHVSFGCSSSGIIAMMVINAIPFALLDYLGVGIGGGVMVAFMLYLLAFEEMHWRIHLGRLPHSWDWMRQHHFKHHKLGTGCYNVFLPLGDKLFRTM